VGRTVRRIGWAVGPVTAPISGTAPKPAKALKSDSFLTFSPAAAPPLRPTAILDRNWERRIQGGTLAPERSIDLHGHSLAAAHALLGRALADAVARQVRVLLVVTGKPRESVSGDRGRRGAIAREIGHWIETSPYADRIASVRRAHPRHGGAGALYLILRRHK
jgi:DNA-nicking Smr family endonuclease